MPACLGWAMAPLQKMGQEEICAPVESGVAKTGLSGAKGEGRRGKGKNLERLDASILVQLSNQWPAV